LQDPAVGFKVATLPKRDSTMTRNQFIAWRKQSELTVEQVAAGLDIPLKAVQAFEREIDPKPIPKVVELACWTLGCGVFAFDGLTNPKDWSACVNLED
jgi:DNA-binding XRE family transcriptional regulator